MTPAAIALLALALALGAGAPLEPPPDRLYGRVVTASGEVFEGFIRWDRNEGSWSDLLDGAKALPLENRRQAERLGEEPTRGGFEILGLRFRWDGDDDDADVSESGIRFGHIRSLTVLGDDEALLLLRNGEEIELSAGSTDIGSEVRGIEIDDGRRGLVTLDWGDLDVVEFLPAPGSAHPRAARLHGTLEDRWGNRYAGAVSWDLDEILVTDVLDGDDAEGRGREIPFSSIAAIERAGSRRARVILTSGEELTLGGSNDVDESNRGIQVSDPSLGQVQLGWDAFASLRFHPPADGDPYGRFDGGHRLRGTVVTDAGDRLEGEIRWDNDEEWSWEILDGSYRDAVYDVEFGEVRHIRRRGAGGAVVTLVDGRVLDMEDSNDVDAGHKGVYVTSGGETALVRWSEFREATFEHP